MTRFRDYPAPPPVMWRPSDFDRALRRLGQVSVLAVAIVAGWLTAGVWIADGKPDPTPMVVLAEGGR